MRFGTRNTLTASVAIASALALAVTGCGSLGEYEAVRRVDEFTDRETCIVEPSGFTTGFLDGALGVFRLTFYAERRNGEDRVGVRSRSGLPVGEIQIRIDSHRPITLTYADVPLDLTPQGFGTAPTTNLDPEIAQLVEEMNRNAGKAASPYRAATGAKARVILMQIATGKVLKFRQIGVNQALSTTAEIELTDKFRTALRQCRIGT